EVICETENDNSSISYRGNQLLNCSANTGLVLENIADPNDMGDDDGNDQGGDGDSDADNDEGEGDSGTGGTQTNLTPEPPSTSSCSNPKPARPVGLKAVPGGRKQVVLTWNKVEGEVTHYGVTYGRYWVDGKGPEEYAADNIGNGDTTTYTVNGLDLNTLYYFVITANNGCANSGYSDGASSYAGVGSVATSVSDNSWSQQASIKANIKPTPTPKPSLEKGFANVGMGTDSSTASARKITKEPTPTIEPVVYTPPETTKENPLMKTLEKFLPYAGFGVLVLLGGLFILLVKYVRQQDMTTDL
ncbi:MAG: fibronectin type III domain-containing protein, partial [Patescibacteria group bacterium]